MLTRTPYAARFQIENRHAVVLQPPIAPRIQATVNGGVSALLVAA